ncbi:MAG: phosphoribosyltransferase [Proteobacteria bacterium]|nr:phosphoribosyltransferase [Pseudomonadota bacterium]
MFRDRKDAGKQLARALVPYRDRRPVVLALPRGGVPVGVEIAAALDAPLDLVLVRKIGAPTQPELAAGAVVDGERPETVLNADIVEGLGISPDYLREETARQLTEIERRRAFYLGDRPRAEVTRRTAIVVDDGIATGATVRAALKAIRRRRPARVVLAVPVAPPETIAALKAEADDVVCLLTPAFFGAISMFYEDFRQVSDEEVIDLLDRAARRGAPATPAGPR